MDILLRISEDNQLNFLWMVMNKMNEIDGGQLAIYTLLVIYQSEVSSSYTDDHFSRFERT